MPNADRGLVLAAQRQMPPSAATQRLAAIQRKPGHAFSVARALLRGHWYRLWYAMTGVRFTVGRNFRVEGKLTVRGPGRVIFGDDVTIGMHVTPWTHHPDAVITIGNRCYLNGTRFGCVREIRIGDFGILAESHILDSNFHSTAVDRHSPTAPVRVAPVTIERNVWIAASAGILPGTRIGKNSVVGFGSVCCGEYPADSVISGNPARVVRSLLDGESVATANELGQSELTGPYAAERPRDSTGV